MSDRLRTVIPSYADGDGVANLVVTPLTSFAVTYLEYLQGSGQGGATVAARWAMARGRWRRASGWRTWTT